MLFTGLAIGIFLLLLHYFIIIQAHNHLIRCKTEYRIVREMNSAQNAPITELKSHHKSRYKGEE